MMIRYISFFVTVFLYFYASANADIAQERLAKIIDFTLKKPSIYYLENGLTLIVYPDKRAPVIAHSVWYKVGAADEQDGESGLAHFFEHLMFKGTKQYPPGYFSKYIADIGGEDNAYTTNDYTVYYQNIGKEYLPEVMALEADRMKDLTLDEKEFYRERDVVLEERAMRIDNNPTSLLSEQMSAMLYRNHPYGSPTIGWRHEIANLTPASAINFYKKYYAPNNAIVTVVGDVVPEQVYEMAVKTYGKNKKNKNVIPYLRPSEPPQNIERSAIFTDEKVSLPALLYYHQGPDPSKNHKDIYALAIGLKALAGDDQSILYQKYVRETKKALSISAYMSVEMIDNPTLIFHAIPAKNISLTDLNEELSGDITDHIKKGLPSDIVTTARNDMIADFIRSCQSRGNMARFLGVQYIKKMPMEHIVAFPKFLASIDAQYVNDILQKTFYKGNKVVGFLKKSSEEDYK